MDDKPPPRKQLRLLDKSREKVGSLLRRRSARKSQKNITPKSQHEEHDIEEEVPILSRITDPASIPQSPLRIKLKVTTPSNGGDQQSYPALAQTLADTKTLHDKDVNMEHTQEDEKIVKAERRKGIVGLEKLRAKPQATFSSGTVMAQNRPIATQPSSAQESHKFTFSGDLIATSKSNVASSFGLQPAKLSLTPSQLKKAARKVFHKPKSKPANIATEASSSQMNCGTGQSHSAAAEARDEPKGFVGGKFISSEVFSGDNRSTHQQASIQKVPKKRLFDDYKLGANTTRPFPRIDAAEEIDDISNFVRPQIANPETSSAIYRSFYHKPAVSRAAMHKSLPDSLESQQFAEDIEIGMSPARRNENGDVPALVHDSHTERVPLGARRGSASVNVMKGVFPGRPISQPEYDFAQAPGRPSVIPFSAPENLHTEPGRLAKAYLSSTTKNLKRKRRADATLPPPSYIHQHTARPTFNLFSNGVLLYPELCLLVAAYLPVQTLVNLYSISKDYHVILNQRLTTVMLNQASIKAPAAVRCYPWRCYTRLCQPDPAYASATVALNKNLSSHTSGSTINIAPAPPAIHESTSLPGQHSTHTIKNTLIEPPVSKRKVPTFRWLKMALHREKSMHEIYQLFAERGVPLPGDPTDTSRNSFCLTLHKLWFAFDIPDNTRRMAYFKSHTLITPTDLSNILTFLVKVDMVCNDPVAGEKRDALRKLFMSSIDGFDTLRKVLKREMWTDELEVLRAWTRYGFQLDREDPNEPPVGGGWVPLGLDEDDHAASDYVFGIPRDEAGLLKKESWGKLNYDPVARLRTHPAVGRTTTFLMRPDQIVIREAVRRGMRMGKQFLRALMYGYVDEETLGAVPPRDLNGGRSRVLEEEDEYGVDDLVGGVRALRVEDGGDPLLDLGDTWQGSVLTVKHVGATKQQLERIKEEKERLEGYKQGWKEDVEREEARRTYRGFTYVDE